jgi:hypothetical protein
MRRSDNRLPRGRDESGAVLVLALIFTMVVALVVGSLAMASANDILNIANFKSSRSTLAAAEGATQAQIGAMRYVYATTCSGTPYTLNGTSIVVTCTATVNPASGRTINYSAYPQGHPSSVLITANVTFVDYSSDFNADDCSASTPNPKTCGVGMTVNSWVVTPGG